LDKAGLALEAWQEKQHPRETSGQFTHPGAEQSRPGGPAPAGGGGQFLTGAGGAQSLFEHKGEENKDAASFERVRGAVSHKADDPDALAAWIKDRIDPGWRSRADDDVDVPSVPIVRQPSRYPRVAKVEGVHALHRYASDHQFAEDKSVRSYDESGRLHVDEVNLSKATVNPYSSDEVNSAQEGKPGWKPLEPGKKIMLLRDPEELAKAAPTAAGIPLLFKHQPTSADDHPSDIVVGAFGDEPRFEYPYLKTSLSVWPRHAIEAIENGDKKQISAGYSYDCDLTPGIFEGMPYDGVMRNLYFNHGSLVREGRAGPDVFVGDEAYSEWMIIERAVIALRAA
jgi:hypothetical protein